MKLSVSMIALNEQDYIGRAVKSCPFADYICIVDGGSEDKTEKVARKACPKGVDLVWQEVPWENDFGRQRQFALYLVPQDTEWWMRIDSDERYSREFVEGIRPMLDSLPPDIVAVRIRQTNLYPDEDHYVANLGGWETWPRIFRYIQDEEGQPIFYWVGKVHEHVAGMTEKGLIDIPEEQIVTWNAQAFHYGWLEKARREEREDLYAEIPGSGVEKRGDLTNREYVIREVPSGVS
jgi:glycosyltransferase involved in cell wall biosynthesis